MGVVKLSTAGILDYQKYSSMLAGNAAFSPGAYDLLETIEITSDGTSFSFTGLGSYSNYRHLQLRCVFGEALGSTALSDLYLQFNSDGGTNYSYHNLAGDGSSVTSYNNYGQSYLRFEDIKSRDSANGIFAAGIIDILDFNSTNKYKTVRALWGGHNSGEYDIKLGSGLWQSTAAITSIDEYVSHSDTGSRISLYGVK